MEKIVRLEDDRKEAYGYAIKKGLLYLKKSGTVSKNGSGTIVNNEKSN